MFLDPLARDSASKRKRAEQRYSRICPVPGCLRKKRLQELSCQDLKLEEINELLENTSLWQEFDNTCTRTKQGETLAKECLNQCSVTLAASILYKNWQRPGAIANATLEEFSACKLMQQKDGKAPSVYVMCVKEHKTAQDGYARVLLEGIDYSRILLYKNTVRKCLDPDGTSTNLFVLSGSRPLTKLSSRIQSLGKIYALTLPTATRVRKIGATSVALKLGDTATAHLVTRQLSHSAATESQYYQAIVGDRHAVEAFESMELQSLGKTYGLTLPTATRVRKIGPTSVALKLGDTATAHLDEATLSFGGANLIILSHCHLVLCRFE